MDDQNNNPGNNQEPPSPIGPDAKLSDETAGDEDARKETGETDDQPQETNQEGGGQEGQQSTPGGGLQRTAGRGPSEINPQIPTAQPKKRGLFRKGRGAGKGAQAAKGGAQVAGGAARTGGALAAKGAASAAAGVGSGGATLAAQGLYEGSKFGWKRFRKWQREGAEKTTEDDAKTAQKWVIGCGAIFTTGLFLLILVIPMFAFVLFFGVPSQTNPPQPVPQSSQSFYFIIKKTGPATAKAADTERLIYNIQLTDTRGAADIIVTDQIPIGTIYKSSSGNGQYNPSTRTVTWTLKGSQSVNLILQPTSANTNSYVFNSVSASSTFAGATEKGQSCWQTTVGKPTGKPNPPPGCQTIPTTGIVFPPNLDTKLCKPVRAENSNGIPGEYCQMPPSLDGAYVNTPRREWYQRVNGRVRGPQIWGSKELIGVLYTVAQRWKDKYPKGKLLIGDMTSSYHKSHFWGSTVDIRATTDGTDCVANFAGSCRGKYNELATVELGWLIVDTGYMHTILHNAIFIPVTYKDPNTGATKTSSVNKAIFDYAKNKYPTRFSRYNPLWGVGVQYEGGHDDHFHLYTDRDQAYNNYKYNTSWCGAINKAKLLDCRLVPGTNCPEAYVRKSC